MYFHYLYLLWKHHFCNVVTYFQHDFSSYIFELFRCIRISGSTRYVLAAVVASLGGVLFGYDLGNVFSIVELCCRNKAISMKVI